MASNPVMLWQIVSPQPAKVLDFYGRLFGWHASADNLMNYHAVDTGSDRGIRGGVWPAPPGASSFVQLFVEVEDCAASVAQAVALGASVLVPPSALPDGDVMAILKDPCGMSFGIVTTPQV